MKTKLTLLLIIACISTASTCQKSYKPDRLYFVSVRNQFSDKVESLNWYIYRYVKNSDTIVVKNMEPLSEKQFTTTGDIFELPGTWDSMKLQYLDVNGITLLDTTIKCIDINTYSQITYATVLKSDKTLELETIIKPL